MLKTSHLAFWIGLPFFGCTTATPGAQPHDMSAAQHQARAQEEDVEAADHARQYDPKQEVQRQRCRVGSARGLLNDQITDVCWTSATNPTDEHRRQADEHRAHAASHRAASGALANAEARACVGIAPADRDMSPFEHTEDIESVAPLTEGQALTKLPTVRTVGAVVIFRAVEGMTAEWFQRLVDCHLARNASLGQVVPEMPNCPLVPRGVEARVSSTGSGFAVSIRSSDPSIAREILARARRLVKSDAVSRAPQSR